MKRKKKNRPLEPGGGKEGGSMANEKEES